MFWKIALALGVLGFVLGLIVLIVSLRTLTKTTDDTTKDISLGFFIFSVLLTLGSMLLIAVSLIFVLRNSKKEFDAKSAK